MTNRAKEDVHNKAQHSQSVPHWSLSVKDTDHAVCSGRRGHIVEFHFVFCQVIVHWFQLHVIECGLVGGWDKGQRRFGGEKGRRSVAYWRAGDQRSRFSACCG